MIETNRVITLVATATVAALAPIILHPSPRRATETEGAVLVAVEFGGRAQGVVAMPIRQKHQHIVSAPIIDNLIITIKGFIVPR